MVAPWAVSIERRNNKITRLLLNNGADPNRRTEAASLLCLAADKGAELVELLLEAGADPNIRCNSEPGHYRCKYGCALVRAAWKGDIRALRALVNKGADVNLRCLGDEFGSPLAAAVTLNNSDCARFLLDEGAEVNAILESGKYGSALAAAAAHGWRDGIELLVNHGADVNSKLEFGLYGSALVAAVACSYMNCARCLIDHGAGVNEYLAFGEYGCALAAAVLESRSLQMVKFLIEEKKADLDKLEFFRPRRKGEGVVHPLRRSRRYPQPHDLLRDPLREPPNQGAVANFLIHDCHINADLLISLGVPRGKMPFSVLSSLSTVASQE